MYQSGQLASLMANSATCIVMATKTKLNERVISAVVRLIWILKVVCYLR